MAKVVTPSGIRIAPESYSGVLVRVNAFAVKWSWRDLRFLGLTRLRNWTLDWYVRTDTYKRDKYQAYDLESWTHPAV
jgi:hypothetical protein